MKKIDKLLICLDLTDMDESLIKYANFAVDIFKPQKLAFIHVMDAIDIPDELTTTFAEMDEPLDQIIMEEIEEKLATHFKPAHDVQHEIVLETGLTTEKIVQYARKHKTDLAILGKKIGFAGHGGVVKNIIGLIPASVLLISETTQHQINNILVRTNFARPSVLAYQMAAQLAGETGAEVAFHHVYRFPYNRYPGQTGVDQKKLKEKLDPYLGKEYEKFIRKHNVDKDVPFSYSVDMQGDEAQSLYNHAIKWGADLVITGSRLKSKLANIILDSTSEKLAGAGKNIPVLIVKDTRESVGLLKALFD